MKFLQKFGVVVKNIFDIFPNVALLVVGFFLLLFVLICTPLAIVFVAEALLYAIEIEAWKQ